MEPPIHAAYFLCNEAFTSISFLDVPSAASRIFYSNLSEKPFIKVVPPASTIFLYRLILRSASHLSMAWKAREVIPSRHDSGS